MNVIIANYDVIFSVIIVISLVFALFRGGVSEILSLSSWFIAFWLMRHFGTVLDKYLPNTVTNQFLRSCIIFIAAFVIVAILIAIVKKLCGRIITGIGLGGLDCLLGIVFGLLRGALICAILILLIEMFNLDPTHAWHLSRFYPILNPIVTWITNAIPEHIGT